jgi:hypothetical protein
LVRRALVTIGRRQRPRGSIPMPRCARGIADALRCTCGTFVRERGHPVRLDRPGHRLSCVNPRLLDRLRGCRRAFGRRKPAVLAPRALPQRNHTLPGLLAPLPGGFCTFGGGLRCHVGTTRQASRDITGIFMCRIGVGSMVPPARVCPRSVFHNGQYETPASADQAHHIGVETRTTPRGADRAAHGGVGSGP